MLADPVQVDTNRWNEMQVYLLNVWWEVFLAENTVYENEWEIFLNLEIENWESADEKIQYYFDHSY